MKVVTWILRILSTITFAYMCYLVYNIMDVNGVWGWSAPYDFVVTVFRLLSFLFFLIATMTIYGFAIILLGPTPATNLVVWLYNTVVLRMWYMQPYRVSGPVSNINEMFANLGADLSNIITILQNNTFLFLYFLCAGIGVALFLQTLVRMEHKYVGGAFISIQAILIIAAYRNLIIPTYETYPTSFITFLTGSLQILALVSFAYLEISYQMIYSYSVGKPVEDREETLKKQLLALRQATRKQDAIERGEKIRTTAIGRSTGATAFSFLREAIERKVVGSQEGLENLDAITDVRRLQIYIDELLVSDPNARDELTAKASAPSESFIIGSTILGSAMRFILVVTVSFLLMNPQVLLAPFNLPPGILNSVELNQPEIVLLFLVPIVLLFPFIALVISWVSKRDVEKEERISRDVEKERKRRKKEEQKKKEIERARKARKKRKKSEEEKDEWDQALEEIYKQ